MRKQILVALLFFFIVVLTLCICFLIKTYHTINFDNQKFVLKYSRVLHGGNVILNEYVPKEETLGNWTQLLAVNYYPNSKEHIEYLSNNNIESLQKSYGEKLKVLSNNKKPTTITKSFIIINRNYTEYNAVCYTKYKGSYYYLQFTKKYKYNNIDELKAQSMKLLKENSKYTGLWENKTTNYKPEPLFMDFDE